MSGGTSDLVRALGAYGLPGSLTALPTEPLDDDGWDVVLFNAGEQRVTGLLVQAIFDGALPTTAAQAAQAAAAHASAMAGALVLERLLVETSAMLGDAGIETRVLKGPASAHLDYPDPALRSFGDIDLMVQAEDLRHTLSLLEVVGFRRRFPEPRSGFDRRFGKGVSLYRADGLEIDLHRTLALGPFGLRIPVRDLWAPGDRFAVGGHELLALPTHLRLLHASYHAALGGRTPRLVPLRDIAQLLLVGSVDQDAAIAAVVRWQGQAVLAHAVRQAWAWLQISDVLALSAWAEQYQPTAHDERDLRCYHSLDASYATKAVATLRVLPRLRDRLAYAAALAWPAREYRRGRRILPRLRRGLRLLAASEGRPR